MGHTQDGYVRAINKNDPDRTVHRLPRHLVELDPNLDYAPSEKSRRRVTEPAPNTTPEKKAKES